MKAGDEANVSLYRFLTTEYLVWTAIIDTNVLEDCWFCRKANAWQVRQFWLARQLTLLTARVTIEGYFLQNNFGFDYPELLL